MAETKNYMAMPLYFPIRQTSPSPADTGNPTAHSTVLAGANAPRSRH
ncbi:MAG: hypothetical protein IJ087_05625 [Eggerthellaceae bacterium]|nr:hypothetical protein [Eggerthellaceae bacterium]